MLVWTCNQLTARDGLVALKLNSSLATHQRTSAGVLRAWELVTSSGWRRLICDGHAPGDRVEGLHERVNGLPNAQDLAIGRAANILPQGVLAPGVGFVAIWFGPPVLNHSSELVNFSPRGNAAVAKVRLIRHSSA